MEQGEEARVTVRVVPDPETTAVVQRALEDIAEPPRAAIGKGSTAEQYLLQQYGFFSSALWDSFVQLNRNVKLGKPTTPFEEVTVVRLPLFPKQASNAFVTIGERQSFLDVVARETGFAGPKTLQAVRDLNPKLDPENVRPGTEFRLPYVALFTSYDLKEGMTPETAQRRLSELKNELFRVDRLHYLLYAGTTSDTAIDANASVGGELADPWRMPEAVEEEVLKLLKENDVRQPAVVAAIATGVSSPVDPRFERIFWRNPSESIGTRGVDDDANGYVDDSIGLNVVAPIQPPIDDTESSFGTHAAGLLTGRLSNEALLGELDARIRLMVVKVTNFGGGATYSTLQGGIRYADEQGVSVMYVGLGGPCEGSDLFHRGLVDPAYASRLVVVPAGDGGRHVSEICPARLSLEPTTRMNVISVAAHDHAGALTPFSNIGADLASPGVAVLSTVLGGDEARSGSSTSAALVGFTATLLSSMGISEAVDIKTRILASVDYRSNLEGKVESSGLLNIPKALSFRRDLIETREGLFRGTISSPQEVEIPELGFLPLSEVAKLVPLGNGGEYRITILDRERRALTYHVAALRIDKIEIVGVGPDGRQGSFLFSADEVLDIVPRTRPTLAKRY